MGKIAPVLVGPDDHKAVGAYLAQMRIDAGLKQVELAERLGKHQPFVSNYELGQRRVDFLEFVMICRALGRDPLSAGRALLELASRQAPR